jgi:hypothetical protein
MKKLSFILALVLVFTMVCDAGVSASTIPADEPETGLIDLEEAAAEQGLAVIRIDEPADAPAGEEIAAYPGYELVMDDEVVLTVEQTVVPSLTAGAQRRYYSAGFTFPGTEKRVCLVGLDENKVEEIEVRLILSFAEGTDFRLEDLTFIDAEKTRDADADDELCWAAGAADILTYTGWAAQGGFDNEDDVFDAFVDAYENKPGNTYYGIAWFFNGVNNFAVRNSAAASAAEGTGGYIRDYAVEQVACYEKVYNKGTAGMNTLFRRIEEGWGAALSVSLYSAGHYSNGHTVTCWGFVEDGAYEEDDPLRYAGLFLSDSDSDMPTEADRRDAPNVLQAVTLSRCTEPEKYDGFSFVTGGFTAAIDEVDYLMPYSDELPGETDDEATRDKVHDADICVSGMYLGTDFENSKQLLDLFESGTAFYYTPILLNMSDVNYEGAVRILTTVTDADGRTIFTRNVKSGATTIKPEKSASYGTKMARDAGLPAGDYTMTFTINGDHPVSEAFYYNNSYSYRFSVRDSYLLGDVNDNGDVEITDATAIQRLLAKYEDNLSANVEQRAAIYDDEITIVDATIIQMYLAEYEISYPLGEKRLYD